MDEKSYDPEYPAMGGLAEIGTPATPLMKHRFTQRDHLKALELKYAEKLADVRAALKALDEHPEIEAVMEAVQKAVRG